MAGWTDEQDAAVVAAMREGLSASKVARAIGRSRNSVISRAHRVLAARHDVKWQLGNEGGWNARPKGGDAAPQPAPVRFRSPTAPVEPPPRIAPMPVIAPPVPAAIAGEGVGLDALDRAFNLCRWPLWDDHKPSYADMRFCGEATAPASSYCPCHHKMSRGEGTLSERLATRLPSPSRQVAVRGRILDAEAA